jgi:hypothetical protein
VAPADVPAWTARPVDPAEAERAGLGAQQVDPSLLVPLPLLAIVGVHAAFSDISSQITQVFKVFSLSPHAVQAPISTFEIRLFLSQLRMDFPVHFHVAHTENLSPKPGFFNCICALKRSPQKLGHILNSDRKAAQNQRS